MPFMASQTLISCSDVGIVALMPEECSCVLNKNKWKINFVEKFEKKNIKKEKFTDFSLKKLEGWKNYNLCKKTSKIEEKTLAGLGMI